MYIFCMLSLYGHVEYVINGSGAAKKKKIKQIERFSLFSENEIHSWIKVSNEWND